MYGTSALPDGWLEPDLGPGGALAWRALRRMRRRSLESFLDDCAKPALAQEEALARVLHAATGTVFSRSEGLGAVRTLREFRLARPVTPMADHEEWLRQSVREGPGVLTRHPHLAYNRTSGTTGAPKDLPVTEPWARSVSEAQAVWVAAMIAEQPQIAAVGGRALTTVGRQVEARAASGLAIGSNTGRMHGAQPWWVKLRFAVPSRVFALPTLELRQYVLLRLALAVDVRTWTTANPSTLLALCRAMERWREPLSQDLADGSLRCGPARDLSRGDRRALRPWVWKARLPEDWRPGSFWPNLASINCWKGGSAPFFIDRLPGALGRQVPVREVGISASEGHIAVPLHSSWWGGVAHVGGHLIELVAAGSEEAILPHQAEIGGEYRVVLSTTAGLYRCDLGDWVRVEGRYLQTPVLRFLRKDSDVISLTGEKLTSEQLVGALTEVAGEAVVGFAVVGVLGERSHLGVLVEGPTIDPGHLDASLRRLNGEYAGKRGSDRYDLPVVYQAKPGTFDRWRRKRALDGAADGQVKDPVVVDIDEFERLLSGYE